MTYGSAVARGLLRQPGWGLAIVAIAVHLYASGNYGYFRDELYFIVCGSRLDWGYVDQPPLIPLIAWGMHTLFPGSLIMLRLVPAVTHAATIALTAETARILGGGRWAQAVAGLSVLVGGVYLAQGTLLITDVFQPLSWLFCGYGLIRLLRGSDERWWLAIGAAAGLALLSKYMIAFWLVAVGVGLVATPARRLFTHPKLYAGAAIAALLILPNVLWQAAHDWPFLEIGRVAATSKNVALTPFGFIGAEIQELNPATAPVWFAGLVAFGCWRRFADMRCFAIGFVVLIAAMIAIHAKPYYPAGAYPLLFAGGAVALEAWIGLFAIRAALTAVIVLMGVVAAPFALPILPVERFAAYQSFLGRAPRSLDDSSVGRLPQHFADMFGWQKLAALVGQAYQSLPPDERAKAVFFANNYGEAAAVDVFGAAWHVPPAISNHNSYFLWGPRGHDGSVVIRLGGTRESLLKTYASVERAGFFESQWAMPSETGRTIWICRDRKVPLDTAWPQLRNYR